MGDMEEDRVGKMGLVVSCRAGLGRCGLRRAESPLLSRRRSGLLMCDDI